MNHGITFVDGGWRPAIAKTGTKWTQIVFLDGSNVIVRKVKNTERIKFLPIQNYTIEKLSQAFMKRTNCLGIKMHQSRAAKAILLDVQGVN